MVEPLPSEEGTSSINVVGGGVRIHPENARMRGRHGVQYVAQCVACAALTPVVWQEITNLPLNKRFNDSYLNAKVRIWLICFKLARQRLGKHLDVSERGGASPSEHPDFPFSEDTKCQRLCTENGSSQGRNLACYLLPTLE